jgi:ABC-type nitrate/sulfonate/bicarbonate transport system substrate-binding protein
VRSTAPTGPAAATSGVQRKEVVKMRTHAGRRGPIWLLAAVLALAMSLAVAACGDDEDEGEQAGGTAPAETKQVSLLLSFPKSAAWLPLLIAEDQGYFEEQRLKVETRRPRAPDS